MYRLIVVSKNHAVVNGTFAAIIKIVEDE